MKVMTPHYYKDFRCIAGACTDTCCAGWDVDVDKNSYKYYKTVKGAFGKRLKSVMAVSYTQLDVYKRQAIACAISASIPIIEPPS